MTIPEYQQHLYKSINDNIKKMEEQTKQKKEELEDLRHEKRRVKIIKSFKEFTVQISDEYCLDYKSVLFLIREAINRGDIFPIYK